jgi:hypothetical protein
MTTSISIKKIPGQEFRNVLTRLGRVVVGAGEPFTIIFYGVGFISNQEDTAS